MKDIGIVRDLDRMGRVVIPIETWRKLGIEVSDPIEFCSADGGLVLLRKFIRGCIFCGEVNNLIKYNNKPICSTCKEELKKTFSVTNE